MATIEGLFVYPVKGCKGIELKEANVTPLGKVMVTASFPTRLANKFYN